MIHLVVTQKASPQKIFGVRVKALVEGRTLGHCIEFWEAEDFDGLLFKACPGPRRQPWWSSLCH